MKRVYGEAFGHQGPSTSSSEELQLHINVMFLCEEWVSSKGGLPTFNREFAVNLAKTSGDKIKIHCYVSKSNESDREDARKNGVNLITAKTIPGTSDPLDWLKFPPPELPHPDIVIGHGRKFGTPAYCIVRTTNCKWVQFVHVFCEDLGKYKQVGGGQSTSDTIEENEKKHKSEVELCKAADAVVAVGSRLQQKYSRCLPGTVVQVITPGILENFCILSEQNSDKAAISAEEFSIFVFGRGAFEDLALKGYDIIADAIGYVGEKFKMTFVGSPEGQHRNIEDWFLQNTRITRKQVTIRGYCDQNELKMMFHEADLVALPSRTEGFGLVALEAISAGIPVLVTSESGIAKALEKVEGGESLIVRSEKPEEWSQKILQLAGLKPEERRDTTIHLREKYNESYSWETQCKKFTEMIQRLTDKQSRSVGLSGGEVREMGKTAFFSADFKPLAGTPPLTITETPPTENKGWTLLHSAAQGGDVGIIETMLSVGIDINSRDSCGTTPLMVAAASGKAQAVNFLLEKGADTSLTTTEGLNMLHAAVEGGVISIVETMLSRKIAVDSTDNSGCTALMLAAFYSNLEVVEFLLDRNADPFLKDKQGYNVFFIASQCGSIDLIERLLSCGFDINSRDDEGITPLVHAVAFTNIQAVNHLLKYGADPLLLVKFGLTSLHHACFSGNVAIIEALLSHGLDINARNTFPFFMMTPLMFAILKNKFEAMNYLLEKGADPSLENLNKLNSLQFATDGGHIEAIDVLLSHGIDIDLTNSKGLTSLMIAASNNDVTVVDHFLRKGANPSLKDNLGRTALQHASMGGNVAIIEALLSHGLDINARNTSLVGITPLMFAIAHKKFEAMNYLLEKGADPSLENLVKENSLQFATDFGNIEAIDVLLSHGIDIDLTNSEGLTSLMLAVIKKDVTAVDHFLHKGADPSLKDNLGRTVLHYASEGGDITMIEKCLSLGLDIDCKDLEGKTPLMLAAASEGNIDAVKFLLNKSASPSDQSSAE